MIYLKSILTGLAALMIALILFIAISVLPAFVHVPGAGSGGISFASVTIGPIFWIAAALIFAAGFWWRFRRASKRP